jgi:type IV pilus assembly protein PilN
MPRINLLPWREQQRTERKKAFGVGMLGATVGAAAVAAVGWLLMGQMVQAQNDRNNLLRNEIKELDKQIEEINSLEQQKAQFIARIQIIESLQRSRSEIVHLFDTVARVIPDGVYLTSMRQQGNKITLQGITQSMTRVSTFMRNIDGSEWLTDPGLGPINRVNQGESFTLEAQQVSAAQAAK